MHHLSTTSRLPRLLCYVLDYLPVVLSLLLLTACGAPPAPPMGESGWFEFSMPDRDTSATAVDLSFLNEASAGEAGFVEVRNGHFVDGRGEPVRFFGSNVTFASCFPDKALAPVIALRMKRMGYNVLRFHHMDMRAAPAGIWQKDMETFDAGQLDKLDWFIYHLKRNGIYTNLNLHVSRNYPGSEYAHHHFNFGKSIDQFYEPYIAMQKDFARQLLTHENPYTGANYLEEPAIAFVEINNENSLLSNWWLLPELKDAHRASLQRRWREWLPGAAGEGSDADLFAIAADYAGSSPEERRLFWDFLMETELGYVAEMKQFLKDGLGVRSLICDTQASYSGVAGVLREARYSDFIDLHAYWQHPSFPDAQWSLTDWLIPNTSMVADDAAGTLERFGQHRVQGMPLTISEYDHPAPNFFVAEMYPMLNAVAAFQDWDGIYHFNYSVPGEEARITGFFSETGHPLKEVFLPVGAALFRMRAVSSGGNPIRLMLPEAAVLDQLVATGDRLRLHRSNMDRVWEQAGASPALVLQRRMEVVLGGDELALAEAPPSPEAPWTSSTGELRWDHRDSAAATFTVDAPAAKVAVGYLGGQEVTLGEVTIRMDSTEHNWASIALVSLDGEPLATTKKALLVAAGRAENTGMVWNAAQTTVGADWGEGPTHVEGIPAILRFDDLAPFRVNALDAAGNSKGTVEVVSSRELQYVSIGAEHETLWYLLER